MYVFAGKETKENDASAPQKRGECEVVGVDPLRDFWNNPKNQFLLEGAKNTDAKFFVSRKCLLWRHVGNCIYDLVYQGIESVFGGLLWSGLQRQ